VLLHDSGRSFGPNASPLAVDSAAAGDYAALLDQHIKKEDTILYPIAEANLPAAKDAELFEAFERVERERIALGILLEAFLICPFLIPSLWLLIRGRKSP
jgi:hypothetical protein